MFVDNFPPTEAFPISNFLILICSCSTFYMGVKDKLQNPNNPFIDYDLAMLFCPSLLLGTKFGTIFNKILPNVILIFFLILCCIYTIQRTYLRYLKHLKLKRQNTAKERTRTSRN